MNLEEDFVIELLYQQYRYRKVPVYLAWLLGSWLGLHRFYLNDYKIAAVIILGNIATFGLFGLIDLININRRLQIRNADLHFTILKEVKSRGI